MILIAGYVYAHAAIFKRDDRIFTINIDDNARLMQMEKCTAGKYFS